MRKSLLRFAVTSVAVAALALTMSHAAGADGWNGSLTFNDAARTASFIIPASESGPTYELRMNSVAAGTITATVDGTAGTLTVPYPAGFCGLIQADAYVSQGGHWSPVRGFQHSTYCPTTPPTTTPPVVTPPTAPAPAPPPPVSTLTPVAPVPPAAPAPVAPAAPAAPVVPHQVTAAPPAPTLPNTGAPVGWLALFGSSGVALGSLLMRRRRA